jgi:hypothetical protein
MRIRSDEKKVRIDTDSNLENTPIANIPIDFEATNEHRTTIEQSISPTIKPINDEPCIVASSAVPIGGTITGLNNKSTNQDANKLTTVVAKNRLEKVKIDLPAKLPAKEIGKNPFKVNPTDTSNTLHKMNCVHTISYQVYPIIYYSLQT